MEFDEQVNNQPPQPKADPGIQAGQKPKKPIYKKWWFWVLIVLLVSMASGGVNGTSSTEDQPSSGSAAVSSQPQDAGKPAAPPVDKSILASVIDGAAAYESSDYTAETYGAFETAVAKGQEVLENEEATQREVDSAVREVNAAIKGLKEAFKPENYSSADYTDVARNPDSYAGQRLVFSGRVLQVVEGTKENNLRIATDGGYDNVIFVGYDPSIMSSRVLEDDVVTVYGTCIGLYSYTTVMGAKMSLPGLYVDHIDIQ